MRNVLVPLLLVTASAASAADRPVSPADFEAMVTGKTLSYSSRGGSFGAEEYYGGRQVRWSYLNGQCSEGEWYASGQEVCFVYKDLPGVQCWQYYLRDDKLVAKFTNNPAVTELYETEKSSEPLQCEGPKVGV